MKKVLLLMSVLMLGGCAIHAMDVKTLTIPPNSQPVTVTVRGLGTCTDYFLFYQVKEELGVSSTDGSQARRIQ